MIFKKRLLPGILAVILIVCNISMAALAAERKISVDNQISTEEIESVYNQEVDSNKLKNWPQGPNIYSESGIVMDIDSGSILYAKKIDDQHYPASITKILTALVALQNSNLTDTVKFTQDCIDFLEYGDAHIGMKAGEEISMEDALYGMLLASANEVSYAIAANVNGGYDHFIQMMNEKVEELGGKNSHFVNANGLHDDDHYTSARDMALISAAAYQYDEFRKITSTRQYTIGETAMTNETRTFQQNHKMLFQNNQNYYEYCTGGKTGFTDQSLTTLVTFAEKDGKRLVCVTLRTHGGGQNAYADTRAMLDYAFDNFTKVPVETSQITDENVKEAAENSSLMLPNGFDMKNLDKKLVVQKEIGNKNGVLVYSYEGQEVGKVSVTVTDKFYNKLNGIEEKKEVKEVKQEQKKSSLPLVWKIIIGIVIFLVACLILLIVLVMYKRKQREKRRKMARLRKKRQRQKRIYDETMSRKERDYLRNDQHRSHRR